MGKHKEHSVTCECGKTFTALGNRTMYCPECAEKRASAQRARHNAKLREQRAAEEDDLHFCDNQKQIQACLNCTAIGCKNGKCELNRSLGRRHNGKSRISEETREKVFALRSKGMTHKEIAQEVGIAASSVARFLRERENCEVET